MNNEEVALDHPWLDFAFFDAQGHDNASSKLQAWQDQTEVVQEREYGNLGTSTAANSNSTTIHTQNLLATLEAGALRTEDENTSAASELPSQELLWQGNDVAAESCQASPSRPHNQAGKETRPSFSSSEGHPSSSRPEGHEIEQQEKNRARLRWTPELHSRFVQAISKLKSAENATPKGILNCMNVEGLTIFHIKSHLQKYRANMRASGGASEMVDSDVEATPKRKSSRSRRKKLNYAELCEGASDGGEQERRFSQDWSDKAAGNDARGMQVNLPDRKRPRSAPSSVVHQLASSDVDRQAKLKQALLLQMEMQKRLHDQLETQRQLQASLEAHGEYISSLFDQETSSPYAGEEIPDALLDALPPLELAMTQGVEAQRYIPISSEAWTRTVGDASLTSTNACLLPNMLLTDKVHNASQRFDSLPYQGDLASFHMLQLDHGDQPKPPQTGAAEMTSKLQPGRSKTLSDDLNAMLASQSQCGQGQVGGDLAGQVLDSGWLEERARAAGENPMPKGSASLAKSLAGLSLPFDTEVASSAPLTWNFQAPLSNDTLSQEHWSAAATGLPSKPQLGLDQQISSLSSESTAPQLTAGQYSTFQAGWEGPVVGVADVLPAYPSTQASCEEEWCGQRTEMWLGQRDGGQAKLAKGYWH